MLKKWKRQNKQNKWNTIRVSEKRYHFTKADWIGVFFVTVIYAMFAFYNLGAKEAAESTWKSREVNQQLNIDLGSTQILSKITYYNGQYGKRDFDLYVWNDTTSTWEIVKNIFMKSVFSWGEEEITATGRHFCIMPRQQPTAIIELALWDSNGNKIMPNVTEENSTLFDEQDLVPETSSFENSTYFDEIYFARTGYEFLHGEKTYEISHPPLGKIIIAAGIKIFGMNPFGWRVIGMLFGIAMIPVMYVLASELFRKRVIALVTTILLASDFMHFTQTRISTVDVYAVFFILVMYYFMLRYLRTSVYDTPFLKTCIPLGLCGFTMGLAVSTKWTGVYAAVGLAILFFWQMYTRFREYRYAKSCPEESSNGISHQVVIQKFVPALIKTIGFCMIAFVVVPGVIYVLSYLPFISDNTGDSLLKRMWDNQQFMLSYHSKLVATHPYGSKWYTWLLDIRPILYYFGNIGNNQAQSISAMGNPIIWWSGLLGVIYMLYRSFRFHDRTAKYLLIGYLVQLVPWMFITRVTFIYHYFGSSVFLILILGYSIHLLMTSLENKFGKKKWQTRILCGYVALTVIAFVLFYPVLSGYPASHDYVQTCLKWFSSWPFV